MTLGPSGIDTPDKKEICPTCQGTGKIRAQTGDFVIERTCPRCDGQGSVVKRQA